MKRKAFWTLVIVLLTLGSLLLTAAQCSDAIR